MVRTENQKKSQKEWRLRNRAKCNAINLASRKRRYDKVGKIYQRHTKHNNQSISECLPLWYVVPNYSPKNTEQNRHTPSG